MASCRVHGVTLEGYKQCVAIPLWLLCGEWTLGGQEGMKEMGRRLLQSPRCLRPGQGEGSRGGGERRQVFTMYIILPH